MKGNPHTSGPTVLGVNATHDAAACLLAGGEIVAAIPEERLSRRKYHRGFPHLAVDYCLRHWGRNATSLDAIVINESVKTDYEALVRRRWEFAGEVIVNPSHHLLHACYALAASGFERPAVLVLDGSGFSYGEHTRRGSPLLGPAPPYSEMEESESSYGVGADGDLTLTDKRWGLWEASEPFIRFPSLGHMFSAASEYIFGRLEHAGKTMGLAPYGDPTRFREPLVRCEPDGLAVDTKWVTRLPPRSDLPAHLDPTCRNLAAKVQAELELAVVFLCERLHAATESEELCLSGGVALNSVANGRILRDTPFRRLFVTPAGGDAGTAIGAALYGHRQLVGRSARLARHDNFHGIVYDDEAIDAALEAHEGFLVADRPEDVALAAAHDIAARRFVGWFEGASEFGPRALGHRSILCDPRPTDMAALLNERVKFREPFRPYAASVLSEHAAEYFDLPQEDPFMVTVVDVLPTKREAIPSVCHVDGTCRIQTVPPGPESRYRQLIEHFYELEGIPLVLNTSFNVRGEPIVESPHDALRCFLNCNLDVLYLGAYRVTKVGATGQPPFEQLVPCLNESVSIASRAECREGAMREVRHHCQTRTGHRISLTNKQHDCLLLIDGRRTVAELADAGGREEDLTSTLVMLGASGFLSFRAPSPVGER